MPTSTFLPFSHITWETDTWNTYTFYLTRLERMRIRLYYRYLRQFGFSVEGARVHAKARLDEFDARHAETIGI